MPPLRMSWRERNASSVQLATRVARLPTLLTVYVACTVSPAVAVAGTTRFEIFRSGSAYTMVSGADPVLFAGSS